MRLYALTYALTSIHDLIRQAGWMRPDRILQGDHDRRYADLLEAFKG